MMLKSISKTILNLILLSIFLIPLTISDKRLFLNLGEFRNETYIYPLLIGFIFFGFYLLLRGVISLPLKSIFFQILILLSLWFLATFIISFPSIATNDFKGTNGVARFLRQYFSAIFSIILTPIFLYNIFKNYDTKTIFGKIEKTIEVSLIVVFGFALIEFASIVLNSDVAHGIIVWVNNNLPLVFIREDIYLKRVSSISHEPPFLGMYLIFVTPWIFKGLVANSKKWKYILFLIMILVLALISKSRAGQLFCLIEILLFTAILVLSKKSFLEKFILTTMLFLLITPFLILWNGDAIFKNIGDRIDSFKIVKNIEENNSNKTRLGTIVAGLETFIEHPIAGVGYGQQGYYLINNYPVWAVEGNWEIERYLNEDEQNYPPGFNFYVRLLSETGIIGFLLFSLFIFSLIFFCFKRYSYTKDIHYLLFFTTFAGFAINWMQIDTPRIYGFWITLAILWVYLKEEKKHNERINNSNTSLQ